MFGIFRRKENPHRRAVRLEFEEVTRQLRNGPEAAQIAVGHGINLAHSLFAKRFGSVGAFMGLPTDQRLEYIKSLSKVELEFEHKDPSIALGFGLFKMWIGMVSQQDEALALQFSKALEYFSRKGEFLGSANAP